MKKTVSIIALTVLMWGCAKKITPATSGSALPSNSGATVAAPATPPSSKIEIAVPVISTIPTSPEESKSGSLPPDASKIKSPEMLGQSIFNAKCSRCHGLKVTTDFTADRWVSILQVMAVKANLDATEKENVLAYVKANAKK